MIVWFEFQPTNKNISFRDIIKSYSGRVRHIFHENALIIIIF